jgi:hypothetical protein
MGSGGVFQTCLNAGENGDSGDSEFFRLMATPHEGFDRISEDAGHGVNGSGLRDFLNKERPDEVARVEAGFPNHATDIFRPPQAAWSYRQIKFHQRSLLPEKNGEGEREAPFQVEVKVS